MMAVEMTGSITRPGIRTTHTISNGELAAPNTMIGPNHRMINIIHGMELMMITTSHGDGEEGALTFKWYAKNTFTPFCMSEARIMFTE
jgi:hypothetical protein